MVKRRLDTLLAERGLFPSRSRAAASVMAGEVRVGRGERRAEKPGEMVDAEELLAVDERPAFVSRGGIKLANALRRHRARRRGAPRARRRRLDGRLHRLPAAARRPRGDRRRRRLRAARLRAAQRPARAGAGAHQRPRADARGAAGAARRARRAAVAGRDRRLVHLAREGARAGALVPGAAATTCSRSSSRSSRSAASASARAAWCATPTRGATR